MKIIKTLLQVLNKEEIKKLIAQNKFKEVYRKVSRLTYFQPGWTHNLTEVFYAAGINPLAYMDEIPENFLHSSTIKYVSIPNYIKTIGYLAFSGCRNLTNIEIPDSVTTIIDGAFSNCRNLKTITIPDSVRSIGVDAFYGCKNLKITCYSEKVKELIIKSGFDKNRIKVV